MYGWYPGAGHTLGRQEGLRRRRSNDPEGGRHSKRNHGTPDPVCRRATSERHASLSRAISQTFTFQCFYCDFIAYFSTSEWVRQVEPQAEDSKTGHQLLGRTIKQPTSFLWILCFPKLWMVVGSVSSVVASTSDSHHTYVVIHKSLVCASSSHECQ